MKSVFIIAVAVIFTVGIGLSINVSAEEKLVPAWIKNTVSFWVDGQVNDIEFLNAVEYLADQGIIQVSANPSSFSSYIVEKQGNVGSVTSTDPEKTEKVFCNGEDMPLTYGAYGESRRYGYDLSMTINAKPISNGFEIQVHNLISDGGQVNFWITCMNK